MTVTAGQIEQRLFELAPKSLCQSWDNVGLLVGDPAAPADKVLVALDITRTTVEEAIENGCSLIVSHHPVMNCAWHPVQTVRPDNEQGWILTTLIQKGIAAICMHTNLDSAAGGVNDALAAVFDLEDVVPLSPDGLGRVGNLPRELDLDLFVYLVRLRLRAAGVRYAVGGDKPVRRVAVGGGACGDLAPLAAEMGCDAFVTADLKYHDFQNAAAFGMHLLDAGHFPTENVVCPVLVQYLQESFPDLTVIQSRHQREIIRYEKNQA